MTSWTFYTHLFLIAPISNLHFISSGHAFERLKLNSSDFIRNSRARVCVYMYQFFSDLHLIFRNSHLTMLKNIEFSIFC